MSETRGGPHYSLKGLLTVRQGDLDVARLETNKTRDVLERAAEECRRVGMTIAEAEEELRATCGRGVTIDPTRHAALSSFLKDRRQALQKLAIELRQAEQAYELSRNQLHSVKQGVMVLEKHKEGKQLEYRTEANRREQQLLDDMWLQQPRKK
jgi:flagellar export protein FliJ